MSRNHKRTIFLCEGTGCVSSESPAIQQALEQEISKQGIKEVEVKITGCHGFCQRGPIVIVEPEGVFYAEVKVEDAVDIVNSHLKHDQPVERLFYRHPVTNEPIPYYRDIMFYREQDRRVILRNCGHINPEAIDDYLAVGGYQGLKKALTEMTPEEVIEEVKRSGLRGRGGAGFPTGVKWGFCRKEAGAEKYMICNADEGDPGAFMDRSILEADPHGVLEGLTIAGYAIGAREGYFYVRAEYPLAVKRLRIALKQAQERGYIGSNIFGSEFSFRIHLMEGAGAFVCGEETALIASIEGKSGRPRPRPPYPAKSGLWGKPTTINNVKTLASVPVIIAKGSEWFERMGTERCKGTAVFALTGYIANCGLVEVAMGTTLRHIIYDIGGGIPDGKAFKAVQTGGPSGGCLPAKFLDSPVDYETLAKAGSIMGSGGMVVMNEDTCMVDIARYFLDFTQRESCGECVPCRLGIKQMLDILEDICRGRGKPEDLELLQEYGEAIKLGSLCGLGQTAPNPVLSTLRYFREEYEAHVYRKRCPAVVCKEIISSPCQHTCPIDTEAQVYISLIAERRYGEAFEVILKDNPLPSVCGRVCHHPCERKCQAGKWGHPIAIRALKRFATDYAIGNGLYPPVREVKSGGLKVAIVGSGPAGLTAGRQLALKGYDVTIFEALDVIGGALMVCIPEFRLPKKVLQVDIDNILNAGVKIKTNTQIGVDISLEQLRRDYQSVFIATGAHKSRKLRIPGEDAAGVIDAMDFLKDAKAYDKVENVGKVVGIIGGGNAAVDAARVALRVAGCEKVCMIYRRTRAEMPAFKEEIEAVIEEGVEFKFLTAPVKVLIRKGKVRGLECIQMELGEPDESGRRRPAPIEGSEFQIELDTVIVAIGEEPEVEFLKELADLDVSEWGSIRVNPETMATSIEGLFAGGDVVTGANTVVEAMAAGKLAAVMIDKHLRGEPVTREYEFTRPSRYPPPVELTEEEIENADRPRIPELPVERRKGNFTEVDMNLSEAAAVREARRCLRCDLETEAGKKCMETLRRESEVSA